MNHRGQQLGWCGFYKLEEPHFVREPMAPLGFFLINHEIGLRKSTSSINLESESFSIIGLFRLVRFGNLLIIGLTQYMVAIFLGNRGSDWVSTIRDPHLALLVISTSIIAAAGYTINDYYDIKIDYINKPGKVVVGKDLKRRVAMALHIGFNTIGTLIGFIVSIYVGIIDVVAAFFLWLYSNRLKQLPFVGNLTVSILTAASIAIVAVYYQSNQYLIFTYSLFAFAISVIREIIKDIEDIKGDQNFGLRTLPIYWGIRRTKQLLYSLILCFMLLIYWQLARTNLQSLTYYFALLLPFLVHYVYLLAKADTTRAYRNLSTYTKLIMISGILSMSLI